MTSDKITEVAIVAKVDDKVYQWMVDDEYLEVIKSMLIGRGDVKLLGPIDGIEINRRLTKKNQQP